MRKRFSLQSMTYKDGALQTTQGGYLAAECLDLLQSIPQSALKDEPYETQTSVEKAKTQH